MFFHKESSEILTRVLSVCSWGSEYVNTKPNIPAIKRKENTNDNDEPCVTSFLLGDLDSFLLPACRSLTPTPRVILI